MYRFKPYTLNVGGLLKTVDKPLVMGILNTTPDSFYEGSRCNGDAVIRRRVRQILSEGADIIDIGGYSSRPNAEYITPEEEYSRVASGLKIIREEAPDAIVSVDTFRAGVAERCIGEYGVQIINDISSGELDKDMIPTAGKLKVPYIMMHMRGTPGTMANLTDYDDLIADMLRFFGKKIEAAADAGICDMILDPGFGFSKTLDQNYELLGKLGIFNQLGLPVLVGASRKSMIYKLFNTTPEHALNGTTVIDTIALMQGASILRVHDVRQAVEAVEIFCKSFPETKI